MGSRVQGMIPPALMWLCCPSHHPAVGPDGEASAQNVWLKALRPEINPVTYCVSWATSKVFGSAWTNVLSFSCDEKETYVRNKVVFLHSECQEELCFSTSLSQSSSNPLSCQYLLFHWSMMSLESSVSPTPATSYKCNLSVSLNKTLHAVTVWPSSLKRFTTSHTSATFRLKYEDPKRNLNIYLWWPWCKNLYAKNNSTSWLKTL